MHTRAMNKTKLKAWQIICALVAGVFVGFVNGFLGAGGGMLVVPLLRLIFKQQPKVAHATAILVILPVSIVSSIVYLLKGGVIGSPALVPALIGTFGGGIIGTFLLKKLKSGYIVCLFSLVMLVAGGFMIFG